MDSKIVAYNSKILRAVLVIADLLVLSMTLLCIFVWNAPALLIWLMALVFLVSTIITVRFLLDRSPIAFECDYQQLIIYRNDKATLIPLSEIKRVSINEADNLGCSFDATLHCADRKVFIHKLVKNSGEVYKRFLEIMKSRGIRVDIREVNIGGD